MFIAPIICMSLLAIILQASVQSSLSSDLDPQSYQLSPVFPCIPGEGKCITILYTPNTELNKLIMSTFVKVNAKRGITLNLETSEPGETLNADLGIAPMEDDQKMHDYIYKHQNRTNWGIRFYHQLESSRMNYEIWQNKTIYDTSNSFFGGRPTTPVATLALQRALDEAILTVQKQVSDLSNPPSSIPNDSDLAELDFSFKGLPYIPYSSDEADFQLQVRGLLPLMLLIASVPQMINIVSVMTNEESKGLVSGLVAFGVWPSLHYVSYFVSSLPNTFINSLMTTIFGVIYGFEVLALGNITVMWIGNFLYQVALTCMGMMFVSLFRKPGVALFAVIATVVVFCCLQIMEGFLMANTGPTIPIYYLWYNLDIMKSPHVAGLLQLLPIFNLNKITKDVFTLNARYKNTTTNDLITPTGFHWEHTAKSIWYESYNKTYPTRFLSNSFTDQIPSTQDSFLYLFGLVFLYFIAALYLDKLIENVNGKFENPWFFLDPAYLKSFLPSVDVANLEEWIKKNHNLSLQYSDQGVSKKADSAYNDKSPFPLRVVDLKKKYGRSANNLAVKGISFTFDQNQLLAFLGQNGGGKSTTLKILSGFLNASSGDAIIYNKSVKKDSFTIQSFAGITSQFDLLYPELNALEHMYMYCELKNVQNPDQIIKDRLTSVLLWDVRKLPTSSYSGGMKRRLSVIISTIGDPKFLILDEPTTGMDPFNRRLVWKFLENFKKGRVILLYFKFI